MQKSPINLKVILMLIPVINIIYATAFTSKLITKYNDKTYIQLRYMPILYTIVLALNYLLFIVGFGYFPNTHLFTVITIIMMILDYVILVLLSNVLDNIKIKLLNLKNLNNKLFTINVVMMLLTTLLVIIGLYIVDGFTINFSALKILLKIFIFLPTILVMIIMVEYLIMIKRSLIESPTF